MTTWRELGINVCVGVRVSVRPPTRSLVTAHPSGSLHGEAHGRPAWLRCEDSLRTHGVQKGCSTHRYGFHGRTNRLESAKEWCMEWSPEDQQWPCSCAHTWAGAQCRFVHWWVQVLFKVRPAWKDGYPLLARVDSSLWLHPFLPASWQPWGELPSSAMPTPAHHDAFASEPAKCGLNLWAKITLFFFKLWSQVFHFSDWKVTNIASCLVLMSHFFHLHNGNIKNGPLCGLEIRYITDSLVYCRLQCLGVTADAIWFSHQRCCFQIQNDNWSLLNSIWGIKVRFGVLHFGVHQCLYQSTVGVEGIFKGADQEGRT